ncbi:MAG TPA: hypothetical protein VFZ08_02625 [Terriglobia bacterium]|nr:hypothetical protein [Terriglobia bacterium]
MKFAGELTAIIGLPDEVAEFDAAASQVSLNAGGEAGAGRSRAAGSKSQELQAAADFPGGVLNDRQIESPGLRPVARKIIEVLGIGGDLLKGAPGGFDRRQILLALILFAAAVDQAVSVPDPFQSPMAQGEIELTNQAAGAEGVQMAAEFDDLLFDRGRSLMRLMAASAGMLLQTLQALRLETPHPFAHGGHGGGEGTSRRLDAVLTGMSDQAKAIIESVGHLANHIEIRDRSTHGPAIL